MLSHDFKLAISKPLRPISCDIFLCDMNGQTLVQFFTWIIPELMQFLTSTSPQTWTIHLLGMMANMSWRMCVVIKQMQCNPITSLIIPHGATVDLQGRLICPEGRVSSLNKSNPIQSSRFTWWPWNIGLLPGFLAFSETHPPVTGGFLSWNASDAELWCFLHCYPELATEQTVELLVSWDAMTLVWLHCDTCNAEIGLASA